MFIDTDECATGAHSCSHNQECTNTPGDYSCVCIMGYEMLNGTCEGNPHLFIIIESFIS